MVKLDDIVKRALIYYKDYMKRIKDNPVLGAIDDQVRMNAETSERIASNFLNEIEERKSISNLDNKEIIEKFVVIMSVYSNYLDSISDSIYPPFRNQGRIEPSVIEESQKAVKKMYEFYGLLTEMTDNEQPMQAY